MLRALGPIVVGLLLLTAVPVAEAGPKNRCDPDRFEVGLRGDAHALLVFAIRHVGAKADLHFCVLDEKSRPTLNRQSGVTLSPYMDYSVPIARGTYTIIVTYTIPHAGVTAKTSTVMDTAHCFGMKAVYEIVSAEAAGHFQFLSQRTYCEPA